MAVVRVVHYLNQFFAGVGGEDKADVGPGSADKPVGPAIGLAQALGDDGQVVGTVWCGDNYMAVNGAAAVDEVVGLVSEFKPDVVVAGPSFASGRYGLACAELCVAVQERLGIPASAAMHAEAPAAEEFRKKIVIVASSDKAIGMGKVLPVMARVALKLGRGEPLGPPAEEGYLPQGVRKNEFAAERGSARAVAMVAERLQGRAVETELPLPKYRQVARPASLDGGGFSAGGARDRGRPRAEGQPGSHALRVVPGVGEVRRHRGERSHLRCLRGRPWRLRHQRQQ